MESYFFVPGLKLHKIADVLAMGANHIIIDLEDAVKESDRVGILQSLSETDYSQYHIRIPLYDEMGEVDATFLAQLCERGYRRFVFPKIASADDFETLFWTAPEDIEVILLVESPRLLLESFALVTKHSNIITGIGSGSHDFMSEVGGKHTLENLEYLRHHLLYVARAANITAIDIASMELRDEAIFSHELSDGFDKGYDAKFLIHPWQFSIFNKMQFYSREDYDWAKRVQAELENSGSSGEFNPVVVNGQVIERPHLNRMRKILKHYKI